MVEIISYGKLQTLYCYCQRREEIEISQWRNREGCIETYCEQFLNKYEKV